MDDNVQNGLQAEQWLPMFEKGEKRTSSLGSGAFRFIRTRSSIRRELKRQCNRPQVYSGITDRSRQKSQTPRATPCASNNYNVFKGTITRSVKRSSVYPPTLRGNKARIWAWSNEARRVLASTRLKYSKGKNGDTTMVQEAGNGSSGGGLGKWLREHLGGGSKGGQDGGSPLKTGNASTVESSGNEKPFGRTVYTPQNLYCSLPREHGRHAYNGGRKTGHGNSVKAQGHDRQRCASVNHHEKTTLSDLGSLTRGGPIYGSEGKTMKKRNRDRRRHSLNETHEQGRQRRKRGKNGDTTMVQEAGNGSSGGGLGKWLREHLGGGSKGGQDGGSPLKTGNASTVESSGNEKPFGRTVYTPQNLYCSLPREHGRHAYNGGRKTGHGNSVKAQGHDRQRCASVNHHEKTTLSDLGSLTRGGPIYGSEGKTMKKRNRDRRRHSLNETHEQGRQRRRRNEEEEEDEENEEGCSRLRSTLARAVSAGLMAVTSRSWPDEILLWLGSRRRERRRRTKKKVRREKKKEEGREDVQKKKKKKKSTTKRRRWRAPDPVPEPSDAMATPAQERKGTFERIIETGINVQTPALKFEMSVFDADIDDFDDFSREREEEEEEEAEEELGEWKKLADEVSTVWEDSTARSDEGEKFEVFHEDDEEVGEEEREEEEEEEEEEIPLSSTISSAEKLEEEERQIEESDHVLPEIPAEVRINLSFSLVLPVELLFLTTFSQQRMTPSDPTKTAEQMEEVYREALRDYKIQVDEILSQQAELTFELQTYTRKVQTSKEEDYQIFQGFLDREKEVSIDLVYAKTGKRITEKMMNNVIRRQNTRREVLARDRRNYILLQHRLEDLNTRLRIAETLGEGMTAMDYEALHIANIGYKDRLDERDRELEKLRIKIAETVNGVAQYKEKEVCISQDIEFEEGNLEEYTEVNTKIRERLNKVHVALNEVRDTMNEKRIEAGLLVCSQELREMEKMMRMRDDLLTKIEEIQREIQRYQPAK
ncbi:Coiled-coil domain-containing protein 96 [Habropoda laboriosa]|uniref:Coiled-coil domain-containing protein 96 n=1 Tax=Habropoda laboriosa TaxID=597456 RepID=A0A0L7R8A9_9HYME|nr:Coiled-coil domain-containing protein 96 [Habropoda laboriosa]